MDFKRYIHAHSEELLASLGALVRIPSVEGEPEEGAPFGREPARCLDEMLALCEKLGFLTSNMDHRVGWCEFGEGEEMVAVLGHLDVVPAGDGWSESEPFSGEIKNGRIYGRGTMDDKGPMVAAVYALKALKESGFQPKKRIRVIFGTNEETGCGDMAWYAAHGGETPVMGFTPDGEYPLINGEKGILNGTYTRTLHQTSDYILTRFEGGAASNISPAYAVAEVRCPAEAASKIAAEKVTVTPIEGGIRVEAEGVAVHGSTPELGENAIGRLAMALAQLPFTGETGECLAFLSERLGMETRGESLGLAMRDEASGNLTMNIGVASFENDALSLTFSVRYPVTLPYELVYPRLKRRRLYGNRNVARGAAVRAEGQRACPPPACGVRGGNRRKGRAEIHRRRHLRQVHAEYRGVRPDFPGRRGARAQAGRVHGNRPRHSERGNHRGGHEGARRVK